MSGPLRSKQGCWTCRLRKKKCDEAHPHCSTCESLSITCYGFGPKPDWMNNSETERAVANSLKQIVKHTSRRKAATQFSKQRKPIIKIVPKSSNNLTRSSSSNPESNHQDGVTIPSDPSSAQEDRSAQSPPPELGDHPMNGSVLSISTDESILLMHFLDNVFPLQYPMYKPDILNGGRGWLLSLLLRTKPLYHAALALSAYHRRKIILNKTNRLCQVAGVVQQEKHLEICLTEFQQTIKSVNRFVQNDCANDGLGIATSIVQLVFFELFAGQGNAWQIHLRAATDTYHRGYKEKLHHLTLAETSSTASCEDRLPSEDGYTTAQDVVIFRFMCGTIIWLDIIHSITVGTAPHLLSYHSFVIGSNSQTKLEDIMGCKNWVMIQIGRISALHENITQALQQGHFNCTEYDQTMRDISKEIQCGLTQGAFEDFTISDGDSATIFNTMSDPSALVTHMFAYMASVYLHLVTHGFQNLEKIDTAISGVIRILQTRISIPLLSALVSPLYVIGSAARQGDEQQFFRNIFSSAPLLDPLTQHRGKILPILDEIWTRRQNIPGFAWKDTLEFTHDLLLI